MGKPKLGLAIIDILSCFLQNSDFENFNLLMISNKSRMLKLKSSISSHVLSRFTGFITIHLL